MRITGVPPVSLPPSYLEQVLLNLVRPAQNPAKVDAKAEEKAMNDIIAKIQIQRVHTGEQIIAEDIAAAKDAGRPFARIGRRDLEKAAGLASFDVAGHGNKTPLMFCAEIKHAPFIKLLLAARADPDFVAGSTALCTLASQPETPEGLACIDLILEAKADPDLHDDKGNTPLTLAAKGAGAGEETIKKLLARGANPKLLDSAQCSALELAIQANSLSCVKLVFFSMPAVKIKAFLEMAIRRSANQIFDFLFSMLKKEDKQNVRNHLLLFAAQNQFHPWIKTLIKEGANPNLIIRSGLRLIPLWQFVLWSESLSSLECLLEGQQVIIKKDEALLQAMQAHWLFSPIKCLISAGAKVSDVSVLQGLNVSANYFATSVCEASKSISLVDQLVSNGSGIKNTKLFEGFLKRAPEWDQNPNVKNFLLGVVCEDSGEHGEAMFYFNAAAIGKHPAACRRLGMMYANADNFPEAIKWYRRAREFNDTLVLAEIATLACRASNLPVDSLVDKEIKTEMGKGATQVRIEQDKHQKAENLARTGTIDEKRAAITTALADASLELALLCNEIKPEHEPFLSSLTLKTWEYLAATFAGYSTDETPSAIGSVRARTFWAYRKVTLAAESGKLELATEKAGEGAMLTPSAHVSCYSNFRNRVLEQDMSVEKERATNTIACISAGYFFAPAGTMAKEDAEKAVKELTDHLKEALANITPVEQVAAPRLARTL